MSEDRPLRKIRSFVRRQGRIRSGQKNAIQRLWPTLGIEYQAQPIDLEKAFGRHTKKHMEIGFGIGENLIAVAKTNPGEDFLGIEVYTPGLGHALIQIEENNLQNVRVMKHDAVEVLKHQIAPHCLDSVSIFFPDPWHKKKHHKRRLINDEFCKLLATKIKTGGFVFMATDWENYAQQMLEVFSSNPNFSNMSQTSDYCERMDFRPITKFEKRGTRLGHGVWDLIFQRI